MYVNILAYYIIVYHGQDTQDTLYLLLKACDNNDSVIVCEEMIYIF